MTTAEAADLIGCTLPHVRLLIKRKLLKARKVKQTLKAGPKKGYQWYEWFIDPQEAARYRDSWSGRGRPRINMKAVNGNHKKKAASKDKQSKQQSPQRSGRARVRQIADS